MLPSNIRPYNSLMVTPRRLGYIPALDGLRGISILMVMLVHTRLPGFSMGSLGVDVFFVLSGFLITALLATEHRQTGRISLVGFYRRRVFRLMPCLLVVMASALVLSYVVGGAQMVDGTARMALSTFLYTGNWSYLYDPAIHNGLLPITWSLSVEEQFYILWAPALALFLWRDVGRRVMLAAVIAAALLSASWSAWLALGQGESMRALYGSDTRAQMLLVGCAAGLLFAWGKVPTSIRSGRALAIVGGAGAAFVLALDGLAWGGADVWPAIFAGGHLFLAVAVAALILSLATSPPAAVRRVLEYPSLVGLGKVSYGLYLWHGVFFWLFDEMPLVPALVLASSLSLAAATLSYYTVERYFLWVGRRASAGKHHERAATARDYPAQAHSDL